MTGPGIPRSSYSHRKESMSNLEKYNKAFIDTFGVKPEQLGPALAYRSIAAWDSAGHMALMAELEGGFDVMLDTEDIIAFSSYEAGKDIMKKYDQKI